MTTCSIKFLLAVWLPNHQVRSGELWKWSLTKDWNHWVLNKFSLSTPQEIYIYSGVRVYKLQGREYMAGVHVNYIPSEKGVFLSCHKCKTEKKFSPWGINPQPFGFHALVLYHWATETLHWARSITKLIWQASCVLLGSAMLIASCL